MYYCYAYWFSRAEEEDELFLLMIMLIEKITDQKEYLHWMEIISSIRKKNPFPRVTNSLLSQWSFLIFAKLSIIHTHTHHLCCKCPSVNPRLHRYVLVLDSKKKQDEKHVLILQRTDPTIPHASSYSWLSMEYEYVPSLVCLSLHPIIIIIQISPCH